MTQKIPKSKLYFDGEFLGDFSEYIPSKIINKSHIILTDINVECEDGSIESFKVIIKLYEPFELLCQMVLKELDIIHTEYAVIQLYGKKCLMHRFFDEIPFNEVYPTFDMNAPAITRNSIKYIKKMLALQWLLCLNEITEKNIYIQMISKYNGDNPDHPFDYIIQYMYGFGKFNLVPHYKPNRFKKIIRTWFDNSIDNFYDIIKEILKDRDISLFKIRVRDMVLKTDKNLIFWYNTFARRITNENLGTKYD